MDALEYSHRSKVSHFPRAYHSAHSVMHSHMPSPSLCEASQVNCFALLQPLYAALNYSPHKAGCFSTFTFSRKLVESKLTTA